MDSGRREAATRSIWHEILKPYDPPFGRPSATNRIQSPASVPESLRVWVCPAHGGQPEQYTFDAKSLMCTRPFIINDSGRDSLDHPAVGEGFPAERDPMSRITSPQFTVDPEIRRGIIPGWRRAALPPGWVLQ